MRRGLRGSVSVLGRGVGGILASVAICASSPTALKAQGTTTRVMIRATSHDAKIIGTSVGGARISVYNALTGTLLARGMQEGMQEGSNQRARKQASKQASEQAGKEANHDYSCYFRASMHSNKLY